MVLSSLVYTVVQIADTVAKTTVAVRYIYMFSRFSHLPRRLEMVTWGVQRVEEDRSRGGQSSPNRRSIVIEPSSQSPESQTSAGTLPPDLFRELKSEDRRLTPAAYYCG